MREAVGSGNVLRLSAPVVGPRPSQASCWAPPPFVLRELTPVCLPGSPRWLVVKVAWADDTGPETERLRMLLRRLSRLRPGSQPGMLLRGCTVGGQRIRLSKPPGGKGAVWFQEAVWTGNFCLCFNAQKLKTECEDGAPKRAHEGVASRGACPA